MNVVTSVSRFVSGPNAALAMLRAVVLKAQGVLGAAWSHTRMMLRFLGATPATIAGGVTSLLASTTGYQIGSEFLRTTVRSLFRFGSRMITAVGRMFDRVTEVVLLPIGLMSADAVDVAYNAVSIVRATVTHAANTVADTLTHLGHTAWQLSRTALVRTATTTAAAAAPAVSMVAKMGHSGLLGWLGHLPAPLGTVARMNARWAGLALVGVTATAAGVLAYVKGRWARLRGHHNTQPAPATSEPAAPGEQSVNASTQAPDATAGSSQVNDSPVQDESGTADSPTAGQESQAEVDEADLDWDAIAASVYVEISPKGAVIVHGIPDTLNVEMQDTVAQIAAEAAMSQLRRTIAARPTPSRDDKRLFTKVAKEALRRRAHHTAQQAA